MSEHLIATFDAFTDRVLGGSVAAMVADAESLSADQMQRMAKEFGAPATCFITSASAEHVDVRFFSTLTEYPMCGHGTMGLMTWLVERGVMRCDKGQTVTVSLRTPAASTNVDLRRLENDRLEVMLTLTEAPFEASTVDAVELAALLNIDVTQFSEQFPIELSRSDFVHLMVPIANLAAIQAVKPDFSGLARLCRANGIGTVSLLTMETVHASSTIHCREFAPALGTPEAPASGTTNRANACYLLRHGVIDDTPDGKRIVVTEQGYEVARPSEIRTEITLADGAISQVRVGGVATKSTEGKFFL